MATYCHNVPHSYTHLFLTSSLHPLTCHNICYLYHLPLLFFLLTFPSLTNIANATSTAPSFHYFLFFSSLRGKGGVLYFHQHTWVSNYLCAGPMAMAQSVTWKTTCRHKQDKIRVISIIGFCATNWTTVTHPFLTNHHHNSTFCPFLYPHYYYPSSFFLSFPATAALTSSRKSWPVLWV